MEKMKKGFKRDERKKRSKQLKVRGFQWVDDSGTTSIWERINADGFVERVSLDLDGRVRLYKSRKPTTMQKQRLTRIKSKYRNYSVKGTV